MERDRRFCQNKHGFLNIGSTSIIPRCQNTVSHAFRWYEVKNWGEFRFFISISNMRDEMFYVLVLCMYLICSETDTFTGTLMLTAVGTNHHFHSWVWHTWNCVSNPVLPHSLSFSFSLLMAPESSEAGIWVSPQVRDSRTASWMNTYWSCVGQRGWQVILQTSHYEKRLQ